MHLKNPGFTIYLFLRHVYKPHKHIKTDTELDHVVSLYYGHNKATKKKCAKGRPLS